MAEMYNIVKKSNNAITHVAICMLLIIVSCMCIILHIENKISYALWILPTTYTLLYIATGKKLSIKANPSLVVLYAVMLMRYVVLPLSIYSNKSISFTTMNPRDMDLAIILSLWEMICVVVTVIICANSKRFMIPSFLDALPKSGEQKINNWVVSIVIVAAAVTLVLNPTLLGSADILFGEVNTDILDINGGISGVFAIIWGVGRSFIYLQLLNKVIQGYRQSGKRSYVFFAILLSLLFIVMIYTGGVRVIRWSMLITLLSCFYLLLINFTKHKRAILLFVLVPMVIVLLLATFYKNMAGDLSAGIDLNSFVQNLFNSNFLNNYLGGVGSVSYSITMKDVFNTSLINIFGDLFKNIPYFNTYIDGTNTTIYLYNRVIYGSNPSNDQIIPMIGQGLSYFGIILSPLLSVLATTLLFYFNALSKKAANIYKRYIYILTGFYLSVFMCLNMTILLSMFYSVILPFIFFIHLNDLFSLKRRRKSELSYYAITRIKEVDKRVK